MNKLQSRETYNRYYGDFRGVDFSSDHTQVLESRLAYSVNMYKDYNSGQGKAIETIPGFRKRYVTGTNAKINGIHFHKRDADDAEGILIHVGKDLHEWYGGNSTVGVLLQKTLTVPEENNDKFTS